MLRTQAMLLIATLCAACAADGPETDEACEGGRCAESGLGSTNLGASGLRLATKHPAKVTVPDIKLVADRSGDFDVETLSKDDYEANGEKLVNADDGASFQKISKDDYEANSEKIH